MYFNQRDRIIITLIVSSFVSASLTDHVHVAYGDASHLHLVSSVRPYKKFYQGSAENSSEFGEIDETTGLINSALYCSNIQQIVPTHYPNDLSPSDKRNECNIEYSQIARLNTSIVLPYHCNLRDGHKVRVHCIFDHQLQIAIWEKIDFTKTAACWHLECAAEAFEHDYITREHKFTAHLNKWKRARIGEYATLQDICLQRNGLSVSRKCLNIDGHGVWEDISHWSRVQCFQKTREPTISLRLNMLHNDILEGRRHTNETRNRRQIIGLVHGMLRERKFYLLPTDVHETSAILSSLTDEAHDVSLSADVVSICSAIMASDVSVLRLSANLNATNNLLSIFESYMDDLPAQLVPQTRCGQVTTRQAEVITDDVTDVESVDMTYIGVQAQITANLSVFFVNPDCANITGIAVFNAPRHGLLSSKNGFWYRFLHEHDSLEELKLETELEVAAFLHTTLWSAVRKTLIAEGKEPFLVFKVYAHDSLFVETAAKLKRKPRSKVLSISVPGYEANLPEALIFLLRNQNINKPDTNATYNNSGCGYWDYQTWSTEGVQMSNSDALRDNIIVCRTMHLTQFSFLLGGSYRMNDFGEEVLVTPAHEHVLDTISIVGCSLSLLGMSGIWLTAALFKNWRKMAHTKVLLNLCISLTLQMLLFVFVNTDDISEHLIEDKDFGRCVALGALMQYSILVLFSWMLIIAVLQFQRYVTVIGINRPRHYILKSAIAAWCLPLTPTLLVVCITPRSYIPTKYQLQTDTGICYPSGAGLTFGVVLPVSFITMANLFIFIYVIYSVSHSLSQTMQRDEIKTIIKQVRLSILLFFLLGISWIFGIFAYMKAGVFFSYLFCITATMQGFVLFMYFVVMDEMTRNSWLKLLCSNRYAKRQRKLTEMQSITTSSTNDSCRIQS